MRILKANGINLAYAANKHSGPDVSYWTEYQNGGKMLPILRLWRFHDEKASITGCRADIIIERCQDAIFSTIDGKHQKIIINVDKNMSRLVLNCDNKDTVIINGKEVNTNDINEIKKYERFLSINVIDPNKLSPEELKKMNAPDCYR